jgi:flagellar motility protein MotE (MotC chaperone)
MRASLFSPILILLIITLFAKASVLFGRIQEQTTNSSDTSTASVLVDTAYAKSSEEPAAQGGHSSADKKGHDGKEQHKPGATISKEAPKNTVINNLTRSEIELLKELSKRREKLEGERKDLTTREQVIKATENKIDQKVVEMKSLKTQLEELMKQYDKKEQGKILSLVKIYETMKPKDAAKIFNELEMPVLLKVVSNMKEVKVAPIIAAMDPAKARDLSIELAKQKTIE